MIEDWHDYYNLLKISSNINALFYGNQTFGQIICNGWKIPG